MKEFIMKNNPLFSLVIISILALSIFCTSPKPCSTQNWTHFVRIGGHGLNLDRVDQIIKSATETHVFGIETDNDIPGRYESFLDPTEKLKAIEAVAKRAHEVGNYAFVYIAGLECITANADQTDHTFFKDHPDWVQRKITGAPAIFGGGTAFWIDEGDEDVWISPYSTEWRKIYMERVRQIAATGIDGVYVDIPYWMTHFDGWEDSWASFDDYTVAAFKEKTGLNAKTDLKLGDFDDPNFRQWVDFRIETLTNFMKEIDANVKAANPNCMTIAEIYPGIGEEAVRVGADVYDMYSVVDVIAHEYSAGGYTSAERNPFDWFTYLAGMYAFRAFAGDKASWMLSYSWDGEKNVDPEDAMKNLALSHVMAGTNTWDARGHVMSGSNDFETRQQIFKWIADHEKTFYLPREPIAPIGIYFSAKTRDYFPDTFIRSFTGMMHLLLQSHVEFQIVTPRNLSDFSGKVLILADVKCLSDDELAFLQHYVDSGKSLLFTGETGKYDLNKHDRAENPTHQILGISDTTQQQASKQPTRFVFYPDCPGKKFMTEARQSFNSSSWNGELESAPFINLLNNFKLDIKDGLGYESEIEIQASPFVATQIARVDEKIHIFIANFKGLKGNEVATQIPEQNVTITFSAKQGTRVFILPFLGEKQEISGEWNDGKMTIHVPEIRKGIVAWLE